MKFKWKYVVWLLPFVILWGGYYLVKDVNLNDVWWEIPYTMTAMMMEIVSILLIFYCFLEDK